MRRREAVILPRRIRIVGLRRAVDHHQHGAAFDLPVDGVEQGALRQVGQLLRQRPPIAVYNPVDRILAALGHLVEVRRPLGDRR